MEKKNARLVELLLNYNIDPNSKWKAGWTPRGSAAVVKVLLAGGVRINNAYQLVKHVNRIDWRLTLLQGVSESNLHLQKDPYTR